MLRELGSFVMVLAVAGCATQDAYDIRPDGNDGVPTAVEWQNAHDREIAAATRPEELSACVKTAEAADALLVQVRSAYETDPLVATKVAAVTQFVMASDQVGRAIWRKALLGAAEKSSEAYRTMFFLEQIRWCGTIDDVEAVGKISASACDENVREFCSVVVRELRNEGFVSLFNGKDLSGWFGSKMYGVETVKIECDDGTIRCQNVLACFPSKKTSDDRGNLLTIKEYQNFILRFEFLMPENGNNGLGVRMPSASVTAAYHGMCEIQLLDDGGSMYYDHENKADKLKPYQYTGSVYGIVPSRRDNVEAADADAEFAGGGSYLHRADSWNYAEVRVVGSEIEVYLNGHQIIKADIAKFKGDGDTLDGKKHPGLHNTKGHIGWLGHGHRVMWRNIRIKELPDNAKMSEMH